jgi:hypothetical protein
LLEYTWLSTFNPQVDWKQGTVEGEVTLKTIMDTWERWKELRQAALVAGIQVNQARISTEEEVDIKWGVMVAKTNFAQDWAQEANRDKQERGENPMLPIKYI